MGNFNILPEEIISDIFTYLPAESVLECKLVSKTWRNLIKHSLFSKMHTSRLLGHSAPAYTTDSCKLGFLGLAKNKRLYYFEYVENHETPIEKIRRINLTPTIKYVNYTYVGSFNGLICLRGKKESIYIYNPMTKEYVILPEPKINFRRCKDRWIGFGYLPSTIEYKVVLMYKVPKSVVVLVYTLGSGNGWRNIGEFKLQSNYIYGGHGTFANAARHWVHRNSILVFDLADEKFREHLSPPPSDTNLGLRGSDLKLGVLGGLLFCGRRYFCSLRNQFTRHDMWLYKKKNEQDEQQSASWSMGFTTLCSTPLAFTNSGGLLGYGSSYFDTGYGSSYFDIYDPKLLTLSKELLDFKEEFCQVFPHRNTFVSLKDIGEAGAEIMQSDVEIKKRKRCD